MQNVPSITTRTPLSLITLLARPHRKLKYWTPQKRNCLTQRGKRHWLLLCSSIAFLRYMYTLSTAPRVPGQAALGRARTSY